MTTRRLVASVRLPSAVALLAVLPCALLPATARAEREYEYGMALYKEFGFEDLAEKLFTELKESGSRNARLSGVFGLGGIKEEQAKAAAKSNRAARAEKLYREARELYDRFLRDAPENHPERGTALAKITDLKKREAQSKVKQANQETDKDRKKELLAEARRMLQELTKPLERQAKKDKKAYDDERGDGDLSSFRGEKLRKLNKLMNEAVVSMQRLYLMQIELAEVYEKDSKERKKFLDKMIEDVSKNSEYWEAEDLMGVVMWLNHMLGRVYAVAGKPKDAYERGFDLIIAQDPRRYPAGGPRDFVDNIRVVAFYLKTKTAFDLKDYETVVKTVDQLFMPAVGPGGGYPDALSDERGNGAMIFRAEAHFRKAEPDYAAAIRDCRKVINAGFGGWPNNGRQLLARILDKMPPDEAKALGPGELHSTALGFFQLALQERDPKRRREVFERAIAIYERTIMVCRDEDTSYRVGLEHEPGAWFELGICYSKLGLWYEAGFAFEAVLRFFAKDKIGREISGWAEFAEAFGKIKQDIKLGVIKPEVEGGTVDPYVKLFEHAAKDSSITRLLGEVDVRLKKCANNLMVAANKRRKETNSGFDQERYAQALITLIKVDPEKKKMLDFHVAATKKSEAETLFAHKKKIQAVKAWIEAAEFFLKAAERIRSKREQSYHLAAKCYYRATTAAPKLERQAPELAKQAPEFARQALLAFAGFRREAEAGKDTFDDKLKEQRKRRMDEAQLVIPIIHHSLGEYEKTVDGAEAYLAREDADPKYVRTLTWTRFKALKELAMRALGTDREAPGIAALVKAAERIKDVLADELYSKACQIVSATWQDAATRLEAKAKDAGGDAALTGRAQELRLESAKWMKKVIEMMPEDKRDLAFMASIAQEFFRQKAYVGARELYLEILSTHDPDGDGAREELTPTIFAEAKTNAIFDKKSLMDRIRSDIDTLQLLALGEPESERRVDPRTKKRDPPRRRNWRIAAKAIDKQFEFYPIAGRKELAVLLRKIRTELKFRLQIMAVRLNLSDCSRALGRQSQEAKPEEAKKYWQEAVELIQKVREYHWRDNELRMLQAECHSSLAQREEAAHLYSQAAQIAKEYSPEWYKASRAHSDIAFEMGEYRKAMFFADMVVRMAAEEEWKQHFPEAKEFIAKCEKAIVEAGQKVVLQEITDDREISYDPPSDADLELIRQLKGIEHRIKQKKLKEEDRKKNQIGAIERHFKNRARQAYQRPEMLAAQGEIKKKEIDNYRKILLARQLYQSPIQQQRLRKVVVNLGVLEDMSDGMSPDLLSGDIKKKAIQLGLLTADGKKKPKSEIPKELLKKEDVYGVGPPVTPPSEARPGPEAGEAAEGAEGPGKAEKPEEPEAPAEEADPEEPVGEEPAAEDPAPLATDPGGEPAAEAGKGVAP